MIVQQEVASKASRDRRAPGAGWADGCAGMGLLEEVRVSRRAANGTDPTVEVASADATSIPAGPKVKPHPQVCLEHCLKKVTACLEICKALLSSKD